MIPDWLHLIQSTIPLSRAMHLSASVESDGRISLHAPLLPNVNDKGTAFGGSVTTLATLAGWVETKRQLDQAGITADVDVVIQRGSTEYLAPISHEFRAVVHALDNETCHRFTRLFMRRGMARLAVTVDVICQGERGARFDAEYVAARRD